MKDLFNRWLSNNGRFPGILGCGLHYPDHTVFSLVVNPAYTEAVLDPAWRCLADTFQILQHHRMQPGMVRWVYKNAWLYGGLRPDGVCVGFWIEANADATADQSVRRAVAEFLSLAASR